MSTCRGCGGIVGRDCFNPSECEWIDSMITDRNNYDRGREDAEADYYAAQQQMDAMQGRITELEGVLTRQLERHDAAAAMANFTQCGCDDCKAIRPMFTPLSEKA